MYQRRQIDELIRSKLGIWGLIGTNNEYNVHCVQTVVNQSDLNDITIVEEIPESQEWGVQDLIQRSVNKDRVNNGIIPYLNDNRKIKFFNPLTLILLPKKQGLGNKVQIDRNIPLLQRQVKDFLMGGSCDTYTMDGFYELMITHDADSLGAVKWNPNKTILVAIDGQHRLKALQKLSKDPSSSIQHWKVPVTILVIHKNDQYTSDLGDSQNDIIAAVRNIFVTINNSAKAISRTRTILLNDQLPLDAVTQEFVDFAHKSLEDENVEMDQVPLFFINWTKDAVGQDNSRHYLSIIEVEEINEIISEYFEFSKLQDFIDHGHALTPFDFQDYVNKKGELITEKSSEFRSKILEDFIPGLHFLMRRIVSINKYINSVNNLRAKELVDFKVRYAFQRDIFGIIDESGDFGQGYYEGEFRNTITQLRKGLPFAIEQRAIGFRALYFAYSMLKGAESFENRSWVELSKALVEPINIFIAQGWMGNPESEIPENILRVMTDVVYNPNGGVLNYRPNSIEDGLGAIVLYWLVQKLTKKATFQNDNTLVDIGDFAKNNINNSYRKEFRKVIKRELVDNGQYNNSDEVKKQIDNLAIEQANDRVEILSELVMELTV
jgi:hypothetical protein